MKNPSCKVNIVVLNYNGKDVLKKCLSSLFRLDYPDFEAVVVDNDSKDGSLEEAKNDFARATFIKNEGNLGFSAGNNVGIKYSLEKQAKYILLLNNDTEIERNMLSVLVGIMEKHKDIGIISPVITRGDSSDVWFSGGKIDWMRMRTMHEDASPEKLKEEFFETGFVSGCAMLIRREVFAKAGLLDEDFFLYWEDVDFSVRAKRAGFKLAISPLSKVRHFEKSEDNLEAKIYWLVVSGLFFFKKNSRCYLRPWIFFYTIMRKLKNRMDVGKKASDAISLSVKKAYDDFKSNVRAKKAN
ncbi:MAG: glycosyltransferase family 2 protein [Candidatus Moranbacteria bacterium]|nr:glycosyltransferase family 2 protein [Candidatus Moranbacteria bacterium]